MFWETKRRRVHAFYAPIGGQIIKYFYVEKYFHFYTTWVTKGKVKEISYITTGDFATLQWWPF